MEMHYSTLCTPEDHQHHVASYRWDPSSTAVIPSSINPTVHIPTASSLVRQNEVTHWPHGVLSGGMLVDVIENLSITSRKEDWALALWLQENYSDPFGRVERFDGLVVETARHTALIRHAHERYVELLGDWAVILKLWVPGLEPVSISEDDVDVKIARWVPSLPKRFEQSRWKAADAYCKHGYVVKRHGQRWCKWKDDQGWQRVIWKVPGSVIVDEPEFEEEVREEAAETEATRYARMVIEQDLDTIAGIWGPEYPLPPQRQYYPDTIPDSEDTGDEEISTASEMDCGEEENGESVHEDGMVYECDAGVQVQKERSESGDPHNEDGSFPYVLDDQAFGYDSDNEAASQNENEVFHRGGSKENNGQIYESDSDGGPGHDDEATNLGGQEDDDFMTKIEVGPYAHMHLSSPNDNAGLIYESDSDDGLLIGRSSENRSRLINELDANGQVCKDGTVEEDEANHPGEQDNGQFVTKIDIPPYGMLLEPHETDSETDSDNDNWQQQKTEDRRSEPWVGDYRLGVL